MSQENVELVRRVYEALQSGTTSIGALARRSPRTSSSILNGRYPDRALQRGHRGARGFRSRFVGRRVDSRSSVRWRSSMWTTSSACILLTFSCRNGRAGFRGFEMDAAHEFTIRDGLGRVLQGLDGDRDEALEAAGLRE